MSIEQYDPKTPLSYLAIISDFLRQHADFKRTSDIINHFGVDCVTDVTDAPEREALKSIQPLPEDFHERAFQCKESVKRRGIIEATFHQTKLVNLRVQLFFRGWFPRRAALKFVTREVLPTISGIIGSPDVIEEDPYPAFVWSDFHGLRVHTGFHAEYAYVSTWLTNTAYLT